LTALQALLLLLLLLQALLLAQLHGLLLPAKQRTSSPHNPVMQRIRRK
jgi:hypothetical protein